MNRNETSSSHFPTTSCGGTLTEGTEYLRSPTSSPLDIHTMTSLTRTMRVCNADHLLIRHRPADQVADILARISMYLLTSPSPSFASLIKPILTPQSIPNTVLVVLLDWSEPWSWVRQLREWMLLLRTVLLDLPDESKITMEEVMSQWKERGRGGSLNLDGTTATAASEGDVSLPLGPGEWEEPLGLPLCVVCQNVSLSVRGSQMCQY